MVATTNHVEQVLRSLRPLLVERFHVSRLGYFGSFATGQQRPSSDVDVLVEFSQPLGWEFFELEELLENALQCPVDLVTTDGLKTQLRDKILQEVRYVEDVN